MGQVINVTGAIAGDSAIFEADRSLSGQDGGAYESLADTADDATFPARLAARAFEADSSITRVFSGSNGIVVRREGGWSEDDVASMSSLIEEFFVFYQS
ncbi:MAG: hypothetical protein OER12_06120 [Acidimicrobiia bacterium]|nr:hypothetical protein [Acidimicrobiia bacterium]